jgi:hypothetical protein
VKTEVTGKKPGGKPPQLPVEGPPAAIRSAVFHVHVECYRCVSIHDGILGHSPKVLFFVTIEQAVGYKVGR